MYIEFDMVLHLAGSVNLCEAIRNYQSDVFLHQTTNTQPLASREALGPLEEPQHWFRVVEQFCDFVEKAGHAAGVLYWHMNA